jgi:hypothetical protein
VCVCGNTVGIRFFLHCIAMETLWYLILLVDGSWCSCRSSVFPPLFYSRSYSLFPPCRISGVIHLSSTSPPPVCRWSMHRWIMDIGKEGHQSCLWLRLRYWMQDACSLILMELGRESFISNWCDRHLEHLGRTSRKMIIVMRVCNFQSSPSLRQLLWLLRRWMSWSMVTNVVICVDMKHRDWRHWRLQEADSVIRVSCAEWVQESLESPPCVILVSS